MTNPHGIPTREIAPARPSFPICEAHCHVANHGRALSMVSVSSCTSRDECLDVLRREADRRRSERLGGWVQAGGMRVESWPDPRWPTRLELDRVSPDLPCAVMSFDHHSIAANTPAIIAGGLGTRVGNRIAWANDPPGGVIVRDPASGATQGEPSGTLLESAAWQVWRAAPEPSDAERVGFVWAALQDFARLGFVEVHDLLSQSWLGPTLAALHDQHGSLPVRVQLFAPLDEIEAQHAASRDWQRPGLRLAGGKIFADGTLNAGTAWMLTPYREPVQGMTHGTPLMTVDEIASAFRRCWTMGVGLAVHAIGDGAVRAVLDATEQEGRVAARTAVSPKPRPPIRLEHAELIDEADVPRLALLAKQGLLICSVQPCHLLYDIEVLERQMPHRIDRVLPLRSLIDAGLVPGKTLIFGSDAPIVRPEPTDSVMAAVHRRRLPGTPAGLETVHPIAPTQAINLSEAWAAFRTNAL
jgi:predicted amidohydrolase YtcJ